MGFLNNVMNTAANTVDAAANTVGSVIQNPSGAIDAAGNLIGNVASDPVGYAMRAGRYYAEDPTRAIPMAAMAMMKKGGKVKVSSASKRADGIAQRGKTRGKMV